MPTVKVNMAGVDAEESLKSDFNPPPPGIHRCKIVECVPDKSKRSGTPMLKVVFQPTKGNFGKVWYYPTFSDEDFPKRKMDQFLQAVGVLSKTKRQASFNTDTIQGKEVDINLIAERENEDTPVERRGQYRPKVTDVWAPGEDDTDEFDASDADVQEFDAEEFDAEEEDTEEPVEGLYTAAEIEKMEAPELKDLLKDYEVKVPPRVRAPKLREMVLDAQDQYCQSEGIDNPAKPAGASEDEGEDEGEEFEEDEEVTEDDDEMLTKEQLMAMDAAELKGVAKDFDLSVSGKKRSQVVEEILQAQGADEEPF